MCILLLFWFTVLACKELKRAYLNFNNKLHTNRSDHKILKSDVNTFTQPGRQLMLNYIMLDWYYKLTSHISLANYVIFSSSEALLETAYTVQLVSLLLLGDNTLVSKWFWGSWHWTSVTCWVSLQAYPCVSSLYDTHKDDRYPQIWIIVRYGLTLYVCILWSYTDTSMPFDELVRAEAIFNCKVKKWCGIFTCQ